MMVCSTHGLHIPQHVMNTRVCVRACVRVCVHVHVCECRSPLVLFFFDLPCLAFIFNLPFGSSLSVNRRWWTVVLLTTLWRKRTCISINVDSQCIFFFLCIPSMYFVLYHVRYHEKYFHLQKDAMLMMLWTWKYANLNVTVYFLMMTPTTLGWLLLCSCRFMYIHPVNIT